MTDAPAPRDVLCAGLSLVAAGERDRDRYSPVVLSGRPHREPAPSTPEQRAGLALVRAVADSIDDAPEVPA